MDSEMKILGMDTSTSCGSVGLVDDESVISEYQLNIPVTHTERLLSTIDLVLKEAHMAIGDMDGWAVSLGPGSFTGLRIGVSAIKGLALATGKPVSGVSTLDVLAYPIASTPYLICPILNARKGEVYAGFYRYKEVDRMRQESPHQVVKIGDLIKNIKERTIFIGNGARTYEKELRSSLFSFALFPPPPLHDPLGSIVAKLGLELLQKGEFLDLATFTPRYISSFIPSEPKSTL
jgi:tRNA threonylcarbamoyladenosine biosynthesis protein TsaB